MCHPDESRPPRPPVEGVVADRYDLRLTASDGASFMAYAAVPEEPTGRSVVILPDVRGLHAFYKELAALFAEAGFRAIAIDYFGRTADTNDRTDSFDHMSHVEKMTPETLALDVRGPSIICVRPTARRRPSRWASVSVAQTPGDNRPKVTGWPEPSASTAAGLWRESGRRSPGCGRRCSCC
jgi:hypothetical protein